MFVFQIIPDDEHPFILVLRAQGHLFRGVRPSDDDNLGSGMCHIPFTEPFNARLMIHPLSDKRFLSLVLHSPCPTLAITYHNSLFGEGIPFPCVTHNTSTSSVVGRRSCRRPNRGYTRLQ